VPAHVTPIASRRSTDPVGGATTRRRPFRDSPRLILAGILGLVLALAATLAIRQRTEALSPDVLTEFVLYALVAVDLTMLVALGFVLARNVIKLVVERRRALPFARFRARLVALLLGMTVVPSVLVLTVGSELIQTNIDRWFSAPLTEVLALANQIASESYRERQAEVGSHADRAARDVAALLSRGGGDAALRDRLAVDLASDRVHRVEFYQASDGARLVRLAEVSAPGAPAPLPDSARRALAEQAASGGMLAQASQSGAGGGEFFAAAAPVRGEDGRLVGVVVASDHLSAEVASRSRRVIQAFESYSQLRVLRRPLTGVYLSFFVMVTLTVLVGATWMGLYLAKRITHPVQVLAAAAREIGAGHLDRRVEIESGDEFGSLTEAFNAMADELANSRRRVDQSTVELERKHQDVERRRRYVETVLERITTGVVSMDAAGVVTTINGAAVRLLGLDRPAVGLAAATLFARGDLAPIDALLSRVEHAAGELPTEEIALAREGHELHLAVVAAPLVREDGAREGVVLVLDDVTPLIRAQRVAAWREVARRLAHEIKNPLTPIQLSAERMRRFFGDTAGPGRQLVDECTQTIVGEVESLKGLVDEFAQFARMPAPRAVPTDLQRLVNETLALYDGLLAEVAFTRQFQDLPLVRIDPDQLRRVIINVVDNAVEAMECRGRIVVETAHDPGHSLVRLIVSDDGPGIPPGEREKLFLPYYSTKRRGSGLGLAIVRRIIAEHGGSIEVGDNSPRGTRFVIELPC
jgi:two-component system nitrogen regulation sensor histidine kinase NtrY